MLTKLLAAGFIFLVVGKLFFRPQLASVGRWFDGVVNAMLIAIVLVYGLQLLLLWNR